MEQVTGEEEDRGAGVVREPSCSDAHTRPGQELFDWLKQRLLGEGDGMLSVVSVRRPRSPSKPPTESWSGPGGRERGEAGGEKRRE